MIGSSTSVSATPASTSGGRRERLDRPAARADAAAVQGVEGGDQRAQRAGIAPESSPASQPRCSAEQRVARRAGPRPVGRVLGLDARLHSVSRPIERLARLAEPTISSRSSTTISLLCRLISVALCVLGGAHRMQHAQPAEVIGAAQAVQEPCAAAIHHRGLDERLAVLGAEMITSGPCRSPSRAASASAIGGTVRYWFSM